MTDKLTGLTKAQVAARRAQGLANHVHDTSSRRLIDILRANILTPFNALITALAVVVLLVSSNPMNMLFFGAMLFNVVIGVVQELKAKFILDRLSLISKPHVTVIRGGRQQSIASRDIVADDLIVIKIGDQVVVDGEIIESANIEIDESLLTGESDPVTKHASDPVLSGSLVVAGSGVMLATAVGKDSYSAKLASEAKKFKRASSELIDATNTIMKWIAWIMIGVVPILVYGQLMIAGDDWRGAIIHVVAAIVGMIPEGLVLLTSAAFMLATVKLARSRVLMQQLPAVETLARVNTLLLDKTGTITEGVMEFDSLDILDPKSNIDEIEKIIGTMASRSQSPTNNALRERFPGAMDFESEVPFSSARKWSGIAIAKDSYIMGAPEIVLAHSSNKKTLDQARVIADTGRRVLVFGQVKHLADNTNFDRVRFHPIALIILNERVRRDARKTLGYFADQGVAVKVISGDSPHTVGAVAKRVGLDAQIFDARELPDPNENLAGFLQIIRQHNVFGRVLPEQKRQIAAALQADGDVVAMTGDGINDALALKKADLGIAMNSGSAATKAVAEVILMDDKFSHLPAVLAEGRRVVANIERVSNLFLIKNIYVAILAIATTVLGLTYPFTPPQMTVISVLSIGVPAFFLALGPSRRRYKPGFMRRVLSFAVPTGVVTALSMIAGYYIMSGRDHSQTETSTAVVIMVMIIGMAVLVHLSQPVRPWKAGLIASCATAFLVILLGPLATQFDLYIRVQILPIAVAMSAIAIALIWIVSRSLARRVH